MAVLVTVVSSITPILASAHLPTDNLPYRAFFADDPDPDADELTFLVDGDLRWLESTDESALQLARATDFYYASTSPGFSVGSTQVTMVDYQRQQLDEIETSISTSRWLDSSAGPVDGIYIKDLTVAIMDVEEGVFLHAPGASADGQYRIPGNGVVYTLTDFRVAKNELPANFCTSIEWKYRTEEIATELPTNGGSTGGEIGRQNRTREVKIDGDQWCYRYQLQDLSVNRSLWLGDQLLHRWTETTAGVAQIPYTIVESTSSGQLRIKAEVRITEVAIEQHRDWDRRTGWQVASESRTETRFSTRVTDTRPVFVSTNQELSIRQRVLELESGRYVIVLDFLGPYELKDRRIWSRAIFDENQELQNVWGVYSVQAPHQGWITSNEDPSAQPYHFPSVLRLHMTSRSATPMVRFTAPRSSGYSPAPEIIKFRRQQIGSVPYDPGPEVIITTRPVYRYDALVVEAAPGQVAEVLDIHGDTIPLETSHSTYRETILTVERVDASTAEIRLVVTQDKAGIGGRVIHLSGTVEKTVRTNDRGEAIVHPTRRFVTAEFRGDDWLDERSVYYGPDRETVRIEPATASLLGAIIEFAGRLSSVGVVVVLTVLGLLWYRSR